MINIILPAYNEESSLGLLLEAIRNNLADYQFKVLIVNDGSTDRTVEIAEQFKNKIHLTIVSHPTNQGLGQAIQTGISYLFKKNLLTQNDIIVTMDADFTHPPDLILKLLGEIEEGADLVIASRYRPGSQGKGVPLLRHILSCGVNILLRLIFPITGVRDYTGGYRAYQRNILEKALAYYQDKIIEEAGFTCMLELLLKLSVLQPGIREVPLVLRYDLKKGKSKIKITATIWQYVKLMIKMKIRLSRGVMK